MSLKAREPREFWIERQHAARRPPKTHIISGNHVLYLGMLLYVAQGIYSNTNANHQAHCRPCHLDQLQWYPKISTASSGSTRSPRPKHF